MSDSPDLRISAAPTPGRELLLLGAVNALLSVALGAFGAHALKAHITPDLLAVYHTGVQYHQFHAHALLICGLLASNLSDSSRIRLAGRLMLAGIVVFCGSLYALSISGVKVLGAITPIGGVCFMTAWLLLIMAIAKDRRG